MTHFRIQNSPSQIQNSYFQHPPPRLTKQRCRNPTTHHHPLLPLSHPLDHSLTPPPRSSQHPLDYLLGQSLPPYRSSTTIHQRILPRSPLTEEKQSENRPDSRRKRYTTSVPLSCYMNLLRIRTWLGMKYCWHLDSPFVIMIPCGSKSPSS